MVFSSVRRCHRCAHPSRFATNSFRTAQRHSVLDLTTLSGHKLSSTSKGVPDILDGITIEDAPKRGLNLLKQPFPAPVAVIRQSAVRANIELMRRYTQSASVELAPHGKTTMAPQ